MNSSVYQKNSGSEKSYASERGEGGIKNFRQMIFASQCENFRRGDSFSVPLISGIKKFYASEDYVTTFDFLLAFFCLTLSKSFVGEHFCAVFQKIS